MELTALQIRTSTYLMMNHTAELKDQIEEQIRLLSKTNTEESTHMINQILRPMIIYINKTSGLLHEAMRISSKHIT